MYQGRQSHGWFGHGTGPGKAQTPPSPSQSAETRAQRIHDLGHTLIVGLPAAKRYHDAARLSAEDHARLGRVLTAVLQALKLGGPAIARRVFGMPPDTPGIDGFVRAARLIRDARGNNDLRAATDALGRAALDIGLDQFKLFLRQADAHLDGQGGLLRLVRDMPGTAAPRTDAPARLPGAPMPGRLPWGPLIAGLAVQALPALRNLVARGDVRDTMTRFGLNPSKPADVTAAYAFLWAEDHGPWLFGTPQTGPAMLAMAERVMRAAHADPDLFGRAVAGDEAAQQAFSAAVAPPAPGSGIETRNDEERALVAQMTGEGKSGADIQAALDGLRAAGNASTAEQRRNTPGVAVVSTPLPRVDGQWLSNHLMNQQGAAIPAQVADKLVGRSFPTFKEFREALWQAVATTPELAQQFNAQNLKRMRNGSAPFAPEPEIGQRSGVWELHHDPEIGRGGSVYDLSTITVVMPSQHDVFHYGRK